MTPSEHRNVDRRGPVRLLTLTTLFPNSRQPRHGIFVANRLRRICDTGRVASSVIAAVPWFPGAYGDRVRIPQAEEIFGFAVRHPRYLNVPGVGMRIQPDSLARALLDELGRCRMGADMFDAIDAHYFYPDGVAAARVANELRLPLVISARGSDINRVGDIRFARQRMLSAAKRAQALVAVSADLAKKMTEYGMRRDRVHVLRNGVDTKLFAPHPRAAARRKLGLCTDGSLVIGVGNCVPLKGFDLLIRAASALQGVRLLIVGEGPLRDDLAALAQALMPGRIEFRPNMPQEELRYAYASADVLGLASLSEGWPNVILEAIACGTPVVASAVGGVPEILSNDAPAKVIPDRSVESWTEALRKILAKQIAPAKVRQYAGRFGWDEIVMRQCVLYESVVAAYQGTTRYCR